MICGHLIYNDTVPRSPFKTIWKKSDCHIYFIKQKLAFKIAFHLNLKKFSNGHHFAVESFQNKNVSEVLKLFNK